MIDSEKLSSYLVLHRKKLGLSVREAADKIGMSKSAWSRLEKGRVPDLFTYSKLCEWIGVEMDFFRIYSKRTTDTPSLLVQLRADRNLDSDFKEALEVLIKTAYDKLKTENNSTL